MRVILAQSATEVVEACGLEPGWACQQVFRATGNLSLARLADLVIGPAVAIGVVVVLALAAIRVLDPVINAVVERVVARSLPEEGEPAAPDRERAETRARTLGGVLKALAVGAVWALAGLMVLGELGINLAPLLAGLGIVGVALGFGAQNVVSDFVSGLFLLAEDQYGVGDVVEIGGTFGVVEEVGLRATRIRLLDGRLWTVRNGEVTSSSNANKGWGRAVLDVGVSYDADLRRAADIIRDVAEEIRSDPEHAEKFLEEPEIWGVEDLGDDSVSIRLACKTAPTAQWGLARELRLRIKEALDREGFEIPFPQRTVWIRTEPDTLAEPIPVARAGEAEAGADGSGP